MLTNIPKVGDRVVIDFNNTRTHPKHEEVVIKKIGRKYLYVDGTYKDYGFHLNGKGATISGYELFDSVEAWEKSKQRDRNITKIKKAVSAYGFGDGLSDEDLEMICKLIEVKKNA